MSDLKPFHFTGADGKTHELPDIRVLSARQVSAFERLDVQVIEEALRSNGTDQTAIDALLDLPIHQLTEVMSDWANSDGEGKSSKPSPSPSGTGTPSKRTSRSGGSTRKR